MQSVLILNLHHKLVCEECGVQVWCCGMGSNGGVVLQVTVNMNVVDAAGEVDVPVTTEPNAFVGVLAVDQRALITHSHFPQVIPGES